MFKTGFIKLNKNVEVKEQKPKTTHERGVVYLGHIPHGFYENEMKQYFSQFGEVTNINLPKSKKTGRARGFGFVEFEFPEVAKVVAETMNNYLMHKKIIKAKYLSPDEIRKTTFRYCNKKSIPLVIKNRSIQRKIMERPLDPEREEKSKMALEKRLKAFKKKLNNKGISYEIQMFNPETPKQSNKMSKKKGIEKIVHSVVSLPTATVSKSSEDMEIDSKKTKTTSKSQNFINTSTKDTKRRSLRKKL
ncbi:uncharacterized protein LOC126840331 [Adelges cooleyi]|uniref:uncharacterized protein LOC126840331 n=1 Tax=Adelges cooleyi TaxID=133065 RepID=UPI002180487C|nr:uncharacterized protein LOC126840331 [Adelges cooleyi]